MHPIEPLISGVTGCESGRAELTNFSTGQSATWYTDFEGTDAQTGNVTLDANGGATVYVNELTRVKVFDSAGTEKRSFVAAASANAIEYIGQSFTGTEYNGTATGTSKPTTLQSILDLVFTRYGNTANAIDWNIDNGGTKEDIPTALGNLWPVFNVTASGYDAEGDGIADDQNNIQSAIDDANAAGAGYVYFPKGTYRIASTLTLKAGVILVGEGMGDTIIEIDNASNAAAFTINGQANPEDGPNGMRDLQIRSVQNNSTALLNWSGTSGHRFHAERVFLDGVKSTGDLVTITATSGVMRFVECRFEAAVTGSDIVDSAILIQGGRVLFESCDFVITVATYSSTVAMLEGGGLFCRDCLFDMATVSSGTVIAFLPEDTGGVAYGAAVGCEFRAASGSTSTAIGQVSLGSTGLFYEAGNLFDADVDTWITTPSAAAEGPGMSSMDREGRAYAVDTTSETTENVDTERYAGILVNHTANVGGILTISTTKLGKMHGQTLTIVYRNQTGIGVLVTLNPAQFQSDAGSGILVADAKFRSWHFRAIPLTAGAAPSWVQVGANSGDF